MGLLTRVTKENADEQVAAVMENFEQAVGAVPKPLQVMATSPGLFLCQTAVIGYYRNHPNLDGTLLACIRYLAADALAFGPCRDFNYNLLQKMGMSEAELKAMQVDYSAAPLEPHEVSLLKFVIDGVKGKKSSDEAEVQQLLAIGWQEADLVDAVNQGFGMLSHGRVLEYLQEDV